NFREVTVSVMGISVSVRRSRATIKDVRRGDGSLVFVLQDVREGFTVYSVRMHVGDSATSGRLMPMAYLVGRSIASLVALSILIPALAWSQAPEAPTEWYKRFKAGDTAALTALRSAAEAGDADSQFQLGRAYANGGPNLPRDDVAAAQWLEKASQQGHVEAQVDLGNRYSAGQGLPKDDERAFFWRTKSAESGFAPGQFSLGAAFFTGTGTKKDWPQALGWFRKAAEQGYVPAMTALANMYAYGGGTPKDPAEALRWLEKPIASGSTVA